MRPKIVIFFICMLTWLGLTWSLKWLSVLAGALTSLFVAFYTWDMFNPRFSTAHLFSRILWFLYYIPVFLWEAVKANLDVAYRVVHPSVPINPGIVKIKTELKSDLGLAFLANSITLTPGTMSVDIDKEKGYIYIHWIAVKDKEIEKATRIISGTFEPILRRIFE
ncbi:MAG: Na+/H+ antiporter subunit E [Candidatus Sumerlaeota bacterium]|nr:Na+/H+ antiporter subunit E [Candidatus Sumerlaeota bacterium]